MSATPKPPTGLNGPGRDLWRSVVADVDRDCELDARELHLLKSAAQAVDRAAELEKLIGAEGLMIAGSKGQARLHPAIAEARLQTQLAAVLVGKIELQAPEPKTGRLNGRQRANLRRLSLERRSA
jgi:hypothetical protein